MVSFRDLTNENGEEVAREITENLPKNEKREMTDMILTLARESSDDVEYAVSFFCGCLNIRIFDTGRYYFLFPYEISREYDITLALRKTAEYATRQEIPLVFCDVPPDDLAYFAIFSHLNIDKDIRSGAFRVSIKNECSLIDEIPELVGERVKLNALNENDKDAYFRLSTDKNINKYWGYNYIEDIKNPDTSYFLNQSRLEFLNGISLSFAIRCEEELVGEAVLYAFDGMGNAEVAIRLFEEYQGRGLASETLSLLLDYSKSIGLSELYARIMKENVSSVRFAKKFTDRTKKSEENGVLTFIFPLYE